MTASIVSAPEAAGTDITEAQISWRARRRQVRELRLRDQTSARLAELDHIASILNEAADFVRMGWLQHRWFAYRDDTGQIRTVNAYNAKQMTGHPVIEACLVGAIVQAGGGLSQIRTQVVQRAVDLTWHTLFKTPQEMIRRTPAPVVHTQRVQDLTRWNDTPGRTAHDAEQLLRRSARAAKSEADMRLRAIAQEPLAVS
jgi:hypothetical protein